MDQNDIDSLSDDTPNPEEGSASDGGASADAGSDNAGELTQADIDAALAGESNAPAAGSGGPPASEDGDFNQADIDALMNGAETPAGESTETAAEPADRGGIAASEDGEFSQADIDALMNGAAESPGEENNAGAEKASTADAAPVGLDSEGRPLDELGAAMAAALAEEQAAPEAAGDTSASAADLPVEEVQLPAFDQEELASAITQPISLLHDVELHVKIELGRTNMFVEDVLRLGEGSVVELDRLAGDPVDVYVNGRLVARGEVLVLNDNFCVRVSEIISEADARLAG